MSDKPVEVEVRLTRLAELSQAQKHYLVDFINKAYATHPELLPSDRTSYSSFDEEIGDSDLILVIEQPLNKILATAYVHPDEADENALYFGMAAVDTAFQGRGFGSQLLRAAEDFARQSGLSKVRLIAAQELGNVDYYLHHSYQIVATELKPKGTWGSLAPYTVATMEKEV